jgi:hypothetical protein
LPHMVVLTIKVWRTRTLFLVRHLWILDWLVSHGADPSGLVVQWGGI